MTMADLTRGPYCEKLDRWYAEERAAGRVVDLKFMPWLPGDEPGSLEEQARAVYEVLTGVIKSEEHEGPL
jgi:hypothetical protein